MTAYMKARERVLSYGKDEVSISDLLTFVAGPRIDGEVIEKISSLPLSNLLDYSTEEMMEFGLTKSSSEKLYATLALIELLLEERSAEVNQIRSPKDAALILQEIAYETQEHFVAIFLNTKNEVLGKKKIFTGTLSSSIVHPREVFREALKVRSASIIVGHNHPSGNPAPSPEDIEVTKRLVEAGRIIGIEVIDHIIVGENNFISLKERGQL